MDPTTGVVFYESDEGEDPASPESGARSSAFKLMDEEAVQREERARAEAKAEIRDRRSRSNSRERRDRSRSRSPGRSNSPPPKRVSAAETARNAANAKAAARAKAAGGVDAWEEDFEGLASAVRRPKAATSGARPSSARARPGAAKQSAEGKMNATRPATAGPSRRGQARGDDGELEGKVSQLEETVANLRADLAAAKELLTDTRTQQDRNDNAISIDSKLAEKLALLRREQERNVRVVEALIRQRDEAETKAKRLERVLMDDVEGIAGGGGNKRGPPASSLSPRGGGFGTAPRSGSESPRHKSGSQRPGESDEAYERRIEARHRELVRPFKNMEVHEATRRRKQIADDDAAAKKALKEDMLLAQERDRLVAGLDAREFSFCEKDRERLRQKEEATEAARKDKERHDAELLFKARPVKLYFTENWEDIARKQDAERKQRVAARAAQIQTISQLPARMAMHEAMKGQDGYVQKVSASQRTMDKLEAKKKKQEFKVKIDAEHYAEVIKAKQDRWEEKLMATKEAVRAHATVPNRELPIERRQREYEEKCLLRNKRLATKEAEKKAELDELERIAKEKALAANVAPPKMTKAYQQKVKQIADMKLAEKEKMDKDAKDDARRKKKQDEINAEVRAMVAEMERERRASFGGSAQEKAEQTRRAKEEEFKKRQKELKDRLLEVQKKHKAEGGLVGATEKAINMQKARRQALNFIAETVGYGGGGGDNSKWHARASQDDLFDDSEKAYLGYSDGR